jgi:pimeloyl-ACP methyl ester carboxylesterase
MRIEDGGGSSRKPPAEKPAPKRTTLRGPGSKFALKNDGGVKKAVPSASGRLPSEGDGIRVTTAYRPGSKFALKNDGGVKKAVPSASGRLPSEGDGIRVTTAYRPGSRFALKNDGPAGERATPARPGLTDQQALAVAGNVHDAMHGDLVGTREGQAFDALRGLSAAEVRQVAYQYEIKYKGLDPERASLEEFQVEGSSLYSRLKAELGANAEIGATGHDWAQAQALLRGDTAAADAIALQTALERPWLLPGGRADEILSILRRAEPAERQALIEAFAKDFAARDHSVVRGMAGATQVPGPEMAQYDRDPATLVMNVLKTHLGGGDLTEAVGLITAAKYADQPAVVARAQSEAAVGRLYGLLDRPFPDRAAALEVLRGLGPEERAFVQGLATGPGEPTKLGTLLQGKLTDTELQQAAAYLSGDAASARATALHAALTRTSPAHGYQVPAPDVAAVEKILGELGSDDERRALLAAFERQYQQDPASLIPAVVGTSRREVLLAQLRTAPTVLESGSSTLAGLGPEAVETAIEYRADVLRLAIDSRLVGVAEDDVRRAFSGLDAEQARTLAALPLKPGEPGGRTLGDELGQWYRAGGGGRFTLELQQMLDGDAAAVQDRQQLIDEAQARYTLETTGPLVGVNDSIQQLFGNDARAVLDADAARLRAAEAALRARPSADEPGRADIAVAYMETGLHDYRTAKEATTEAVKTVATTGAVIVTTAATAGTAAAVWAPVLAGAGASLAATQLNGASNSWQDDAIAVAEGAASGLTLPGSAVSVRGGQYLVREAVEEGGEQVFRSVSRSLAQDAVERSLSEGAEVLARGGQVVLREAGRELTVQAFRPTLAHAIGQNVAEGVAGSIVGDLAAGTLRGEVNPQQVAANAVLAAGTAGVFSLGLAGVSRLTGLSPARVSEVDRAVNELRSGRPVEIDPALRRDVSARLSREFPEQVFLHLSEPGRGKVTILTEALLMERAGREGTPIRDFLEDSQLIRPAGSSSTVTSRVGSSEAGTPPAPELLTRAQRGVIARQAQAGDAAAQRILIEDLIARHPEMDAETVDLLRNPPPPELSGLSGHDAVLASMITGNTGLGRRWFAHTREVMKDTVSPLTQVALRVRAQGGGPDEFGRVFNLAMRLAQPTEGRAGVRYMRAPYLEDLREAVRLISAHLPDQEDLLRRINGVLDEGQPPVPIPPPEAADAIMQAAIVDGMRRTGVAEIGIRGSDPESRVWHGVGGSTGPVFPTKPGGSFPWTEGAPAVTLGPAEVLSLNAARAAEGLPPLHEAYPDLPIPRLVTPPGGTEPVWVQQLALGGAKPVVVDPVRDAAGKVVGGGVIMAVSDVDIVYARSADGRLLTDAEILGPNGLKAAINRAYADARFPGTEYGIVNHGAHFNALRDPELVKAYRLDTPKYWDAPVYKFGVDARGYVETTPFGETYRTFVDPTYVPTWRRGTDAPDAVGPGRGPSGGSGPLPSGGPAPLPGAGLPPGGRGTPAALGGPRTAMEQVLSTLRREVASGTRRMTTLGDLETALSETFSSASGRAAPRGPARIGTRDPMAVVERWLRTQTKRDPNLLPALLNNLSPYPEMRFPSSSQLRIDPARFDAPVFRTVETSGGPRVQAEVKTSLSTLLGSDPAFTAFRETYATTDVPLTIRVNLPQGAPRTVAEVNKALESAPTVNWFMHGYQSNRAVWEPELARWDELVQGDSVSIAAGGMGAEGHFAGTGASAFTPKQYAFQTLSAMDLLGLGRRQKVNVIGHSMGGAAAYEMGRALASRAAARLPGEPPPMSFVLIAPALAPDSVSFLHHPFYGSLIRVNNRVGSQAPPALMELVRKTGVPAAIVDSLLPGAPEPLRRIHAGFNDFSQLRATAQGLLSQPHPDPVEVRDFLDRFPTLIVAAGDDRLVDPRVVQRIFGPENVLLLEGRNHYPHLPQDGVLGEDGQRLLEAARDVLNRTRVLGDQG